MNWVLCLVSVCALGAPPVITELRPRGAQRGRPFEVTVVGKDLGENARLRSTMAATFTPLAAAERSMMEGRYATFLVEPQGDLPVGIYPVRIETGDGISNVLLFTIGTFPEVTEEESQPGSLPNRNDSIETAQGLPPSPITVNGTLKGAERDVYRIQGKAGERRVIEVEARRCGSAIDPVIEVMDPQGRLLARSEDAPLLSLDARLEMTFPREGFYYIAVHDARYSDQMQNFYRLQTGSYAYPTDMFPLGGKRGEVVEVSLSGTKVKADLRNVPAGQAQTFINLPDSPALPLPFAVGDYPEVTKPVTQPLSLPIVINGQLVKAGEIDSYTFPVAAGDELEFELQARELGTSKLMGVISIMDETGKKLASAGDGPLPVDVFQVQGITRTAGDPFLNFKVPSGMTQLKVKIEDLAERGGLLYGYRLIARRQVSDFELSVNTPYVNIPAGGSAMVIVTADRRGYNGPIQLKLASPPPGIVAEGGLIPEEILDGNSLRLPSRRGILVLTAESGATLTGTDLSVVGEGGGIERRARGSGMATPVSGATAQGVVDPQRPLSAPWLGMQLPAALAKPSAARLAVDLVSRTRKDAGDELLFRWTWTPRLPNQKVPDEVKADMVNANDIRVIDMKQDPQNGNTGTFLVTTTKNTNPAWYDVYITGKITADEQTEQIVSRPMRVEVQEVKPSETSTVSSGR
jgi:hypothetical protein